MKSLILIMLLNWIDHNTVYDTKKFNTKILEVSKKDIQRLACGGKCPIIAFYKKNEGIYILKMKYEDNLCNQSILLHELIHVFQDEELENVFKEKEAFDIQNKFLYKKSIENNLIETLNIKKCRSKQLY